MKSICLPILVLAAAFLPGVPARASDWPNWRGPNHNGISSETGWISQWPADGPKQLWKASIGTGFSSITVAHGRAYTVGNRQETDTVWCFDAATGSNLWKYSYPSPIAANMYEGGPSATPTIDEGRVYAFSKIGRLYCLDAEKGGVIWATNVAAAVHADTPGWGFASSALVQDDLIILDIGAHGAALDKATGRIVWSSGEGAGGYGTPVPCVDNGTPAFVVVAAQTVFGVETRTGRQLWSHPWKTEYDLNIADAIVRGTDVFVSSGYDHGASVFQAGPAGRTLWENSNMRNHINSCILIGGYIYGVDGNVSSSGSGTLKCLDFATGNEKWSYKGLGGGASMAADGKIIMISDKGELVVAEASPEGFKPISRAQVLGGKCWTVPTLANGRIYCRNAKGDLVCLDVAGN